MNSPEKKKLLILYTKNPDEVFNRKSAIGSYVYCLAGLLSEEFEVTLNSRKTTILEQDNIGSKISSPKISLIKRIIPKRIKSFLRDRQHFKNLKALKNQIIDLNTKFDVILEFYNFGSDVGLELSKEFNCPLHLIYDGPISEEYVFFNGHKSWFEKRCRYLQKESFEKASTITVYSQPMIDFCLRNIHSDMSKYKIHQNVDFSRFHLFEDEKELNDVVNICFVGSFLKWHRVDLLLIAFKGINQNYPRLKVHLHLIGDGVERPAIESLSDSLKLDNVTFYGYKDGMALIEIQKKMHIGVMPGSNWYGAPNKIFEYGAMKMAVLAPDTKTINFLYKEEEIFFFANNDEKSLSEVLLEACSNHKRRHDKAQSLYDTIKTSYSPKKTRDFYVSVIN